MTHPKKTSPAPHTHPPKGAGCGGQGGCHSQGTAHSRHGHAHHGPTSPADDEGGCCGQGGGDCCGQGGGDCADIPQPPADALAVLQNELAELKAKNLDLADQYLRAQAEVQNARRRADEEVAKGRKFAIEGFAESLLPVLDSLEAGLKVESATADQLREGTGATLAQLKNALERNKVVEVNPAPGDRFDPAQQQAISLVPADQEANTVVMVLQKGYLIAERVLRPALVTVAAPK